MIESNKILNNNDKILVEIQGEHKNTPWFQIVITWKLIDMYL